MFFLLFVESKEFFLTLISVGLKFFFSFFLVLFFIFLSYSKALVNLTNFSFFFTNSLFLEVLDSLKFEFSTITFVGKLLFHFLTEIL